MSYSQEMLAICDRHVATGDAHISKQLVLIDWLRERRLSTRVAESVLDTFRQTQAIHVRNRELIARTITGPRAAS